MKMRATRLWALSAALVLVSAAACTPASPRPIYTSLQQGGTYGYFEEQVSDRRFRVGYDAPIETRYRASRAERQRHVDSKVALAYDMALLRAAELARSRGYRDFRLSDRQNNVRIEERDEFRGAPLAFHPPLWHHPYWHHRYHAVPYYAYPDVIDRVTEIAVSVDFMVELGGNPGVEDSFNADDVIERLSRRYSLAPYAGR